MQLNLRLRYRSCHTPILLRERNPGVIMAHHDTIIRPDHHVIMFVANKRMIPKVKKLFQGGFGFV